MTTAQSAPVDIGIDSPYFEGRPAGERGIGVFAKRDIPPATLLFTDYPLLAFFGSNATREDQLFALYQCFSPRDKREFDSLRTAFDHPNRTNKPTRPRLMTAAQQQRFEFSAGVNVNLHGMGDGARGVFKIPSMFNHSCNPNIHMVHSEDGACRGYSIGKILADQELTFTYNGHMPYLIRSERQPALANRFICTCPTCSLPPRERLASDCRRFLISRMLIMLSAGEAPIRLSPAAEDEMSDKQEAAAKLFLQHMNRHVTGAFFWLTLACLCEAEGLQSFDMCKWAAHGYISAADCAIKHINTTRIRRPEDRLLAERWSVRSRVLLERVRPGLEPGWLRVLSGQRIVPDAVVTDPAMD